MEQKGVRIVDLPVEVWSAVLSHFTPTEAVDVFDSLYHAGVLGSMPRLDAFWIVMDSAKRNIRLEEEEEFPDACPFRVGVERLVSMGVDAERATLVMRQSNGDWGAAMRVLGWE